MGVLIGEFIEMFDYVMCLNIVDVYFLFYWDVYECVVFFEN